MHRWHCVARVMAPVESPTHSHCSQNRCCQTHSNPLLRGDHLASKFPQLSLTKQLRELTSERAYTHAHVHVNKRTWPQPHDRFRAATEASLSVSEPTSKVVSRQIGQIPADNVQDALFFDGVRIMC